jgi:hypothetical protein
MPIAFTFNFPLIALGVFYVLLGFFSIYGIFLAYHWYTFGTSKNTSTVALAVYLLGGAVLFITLAATIGTIK